MGRFPTSNPNCWGRGTGVALVHIHFTPLWYPGIRNHKWMASSCSPAFHPKEVTTLKSPPFIAKDIRVLWSRSERRLGQPLLAPCLSSSNPTLLEGRQEGFLLSWKEKEASGFLLHLLPSRGALVSEWPEKRHHLWQGVSVTLSLCPQHLIRLSVLWAGGSFSLVR